MERIIERDGKLIKQVSNSGYYQHITEYVIGDAPKTVQEPLETQNDEDVDNYKAKAKKRRQRENNND